MHVCLLLFRVAPVYHARSGTRHDQDVNGVVDSETGARDNVERASVLRTQPQTCDALSACCWQCLCARVRVWLVAHMCVPRRPIVFASVIVLGGACGSVFARVCCVVDCLLCCVSCAGLRARLCC